jgi:RNA polymerase sigma-70 factor (ECF subfamily)
MANMTNPQRREIFLVLRSQAGDRQAFDELLKSIQEPIFRYIRRLTAGDEALAEDVLQEVFILIYRKLRWLENPRVFRAWVYRIASREAFSRLKKEKRWAEQIRDEEILDAIPAGERAEKEFEPELIAKIPAWLSEISPAARAVLILHYLEEMSLIETAEILSIAPGTAKSRLAYGLESLRRIAGKEK